MKAAACNAANITPLAWSIIFGEGPRSKSMSEKTRNVIDYMWESATTEIRRKDTGECSVHQQRIHATL